jgi:thioredoxin-related protein
MKKGLWGVLVLALAVLTVQPASAAVEDWMTDFNAAKEKAAKEKLDILVDFSGSDWCGWCQKLDAEVFSKPEFLTEAKKQFVLVVLDFPKQEENKAKIPEALRKSNEELAKTLNVQGFPTVFLMDSKGAPYAQTGYKAGGPEAYLKELKDFRDKKVQKDALVAKLEGTKGLDRAKLLDQIIDLTPEDFANNLYVAEMEEIVKLDADNKGGLRDKYQFRARMIVADKAKKAATEKLGAGQQAKKDGDAAKSDEQFKKADEDLKAVAALYDGILNDLQPTGEKLQDVWFNKGETCFLLKDLPGIRMSLQKALDAAPTSPKAEMIKQMLERFAEKPAQEAGPAAPVAAPGAAPVAPAAPADAAPAAAPAAPAK